MRRIWLSVGASLTLVLAGLGVMGGTARAATQGPCDIYASGGTPCVAAHSTTRALYGAYTGPLYQVRRASDSATRDIGVLSAGGVANAAAQDSFCAGTSCLITVIYDQSGRNNRLTQAPPGGFSGPAAGGYDNLANATAAPISHRYLTAVVKGGPGRWAIRGGNAQSGSLSTFYNGVRPNVAGYNPMKKEGAIILGIGGDNSHGSAGTFYEGVMTSGYPSDATENAVQSNIVAAGYGTTGGGTTTGPLHAVGAGKCLDDPNSTTTLGTQQQIYTCSGGAGQTWTHTSAGALSVTVGGQTLCLDANGKGTTNGTKAIIYSCNGQTNQQWNINSNGTVTGAQSGLCLDVTSPPTPDGTPVELWTCPSGRNHQWTLG